MENRKSLAGTFCTFVGTQKTKDWLKVLRSQTGGAGNRSCSWCTLVRRSPLAKRSECCRNRFHGSCHHRQPRTALRTSAPSAGREVVSCHGSSCLDHSRPPSASRFSTCLPAMACLLACLPSCLVALPPSCLLFRERGQVRFQSMGQRGGSTASHPATQPPSQPSN